MDDDKFIDFSKQREEDLISWKEKVKVNDNASFWTKCQAIFDSISQLPYHELQREIYLAYALTPSAMANRLPICFLYGQSGTGKSKMGQWISKVYRIDPLQEGATTASIRNTLDDLKYIRHPKDESIKLEQHIILVWDDLRPVRISATSPDSIFAMLKSGCSRQTSKTKIAMPGGATQEFCTFGGKIISSITPLWSVIGAEELKRRALIIKFKKCEEEDKDFLDPEIVDFLDLHLEFKTIWYSREVLDDYKSKRKSLSHIKSSYKNFKIMSVDVLTTMATLSGLTTKQSVELFDEYCYQVREKYIDDSLADDVLSHYLNECERNRVMLNEKFIEDGYEELIKEQLEIPSGEVMRYMKLRASDGTLNIARLDNSYVHQLMERQGFKPKTSKDGLVWVKS